MLLIFKKIYIYQELNFFVDYLHKQRIQKDQYGQWLQEINISNWFYLLLWIGKRMCGP